MNFGSVWLKTLFELFRVLKKIGGGGIGIDMYSLLSQWITLICRFLEYTGNFPRITKLASFIDEHYLWGIIGKQYYNSGVNMMLKMESDYS